MKTERTGRKNVAVVQKEQALCFLQLTETKHSGNNNVLQSMGSGVGLCFKIQINHLLVV